MTHPSQDYWNEVSSQIATGDYMLTVSDLKAISYLLNFGDIKPEFFPPASLGDTDAKARRRSIKSLAEKVWGLTESDLLALEFGWLKNIRKESGTSLKDDKEEFRDLVTPQILARIYATAFLFYSIESGELKDLDGGDALLVVNQAVYSLNLFLLNSTLKGWSRANKITVNGKEEIFYNFFVHHGLPVGGSGLFLPNPEVSLPYIFSLFHRGAIRPEVYK